MTPQQVEQAILKVLAEETTAVGISDKLFTPNGLFSVLAASEEERRALVQTPLFKRAQRRFRELQFKEADAFRNATSELQTFDLAEQYRLRIERARSD